MNHEISSPIIFFFEIITVFLLSIPPLNIENVQISNKGQNYKKLLLL